MALIELPSGVTIDTEGLGADEVQSVIEQMQTARPELFEEQPVQPSIDLATASKEEIQDYSRQLKLAGFDPRTMKPAKPGELQDLKLPGVDYDTGVRDFSFRSGLAARETQAEKIAFLNDTIGEGSYRQDPGGRFILTQDGRTKLGLGEGRDIAIDEEGFSSSDISDFIGQAGVPLAAGIGAGLLMSGTGALVAMPVVGLAMGAAKLVEEQFESYQGYQRQTPSEVFRDAAYEAVLGATGEGLGRFISGIFGRIIKGPATPEAEAAKASGRELLKRSVIDPETGKRISFAPTIEGAAPGVRPVLNRLQAIYEGIFPNEKAATNNLKIVMQDLQGLRGTNQQALSNLEEVIKGDIGRIYSTMDDAVKDAEKILDTQIKNDIDDIIRPLRGGERLSEDLVRRLLTSKAIFDEQADALFTKASKSLGRNNRIVPVVEIKRALDKISATGVEITSPVKRRIDDAILRTKNRARRMGQTDITDEQAILATYIAPEEAQFLRRVLLDMKYDDAFKVSTAAGNFQMLKKSIDNAFDQAELNLDMIVRHFAGRGDGALTTGDLATLKEMLRKSGMEFDIGEEPTTAILETFRRGLNNLQRSRTYYANGMKRFDDPIAEKIYSETKRGTLKFDPSKYLDDMVKPNEPLRLRRLLKVIRGSAGIEGLEIGQRTIDRISIIGPGGRRFTTIREAEEFLATMQENSTKRRFRKLVNQKKDELGKIREGRKIGAQTADITRQQFAKEWFRRELNDPNNFSIRNGVEQIDGIKLARKIDELGTTKNVLFSTEELGQINKLSNLLKQTGAQFDKRVLEQFPDATLANVIKLRNSELANRKAFDGNKFIQSLANNDAEGMVSYLFTRGNASRIRAFQNGNLKVGDKTLRELGADFTPETIEAVKDASMTRILKSLGDVESPAFREAFVSGRLGSNLQSTLNGYGRETVEAMFGKQQSDDLFKLADNMVAVSNAALAGKGGLAAPTIALGLGFYGMLTAPLATIPAAAFYMTMSRALRSPKVMKVLLASREPGGDAFGQALQFMQTSAQQVLGQMGITPASTVVPVKSEGPFGLSPEAKQVRDRALTNIQNINIPNVTPPAPGGSAASVNPILVPNPVTRATVGSQ
tara:strand:+ start:299 stop:3625 length:3327 start_codon:yes stop_codon:yes gene_type:complete